MFRLHTRAFFTQKFSVSAWFLLSWSTVIGRTRKRPTTSSSPSSFCSLAACNILEDAIGEKVNAMLRLRARPQTSRGKKGERPLWCHKTPKSDRKHSTGRLARVRFYAGWLQHKKVITENFWMTFLWRRRNCVEFHGSKKWLHRGNQNVMKDPLSSLPQVDTNPILPSPATQQFG